MLVRLETNAQENGYVTIASKGQQNLVICLVLWAYEQEGTFIVPHLL
jgi:hypothetical protein